jgi:hypothetical protein
MEEVLRIFVLSRHIVEVAAFTNHQSGVPIMLLDILRIVVAFGAVGLIIAFWYWMMDRLGTF